MGNPLSPFISDIFVERIEEHIEQLGTLSRFWARYVGDIFAIGKRSQLETILNKLNTIHTVHHGGKIEFDIYRKPTSTQRTISASSQHSLSGQMTPYNAMLHRMLTTPLSEERLNKEKRYIIETPGKKRFSRKAIERIIIKKTTKIGRNNLTTFFTQTGPSKKRRVPIIRSQISYQVKNVLRKRHIKVISTGRPYQLKTRLGSLLDP